MIPPRGGRVALLLSLLVVAGCQATGPVPSRDTAAAAGPVAVARADPAATQPAPKASPAPPVTRIESLPAPGPDAVEVLDSRLATLGFGTIESPAGLVGHSARQVRDLMGEPDLIRREDAALLWQYADGGCVLNLFLFGPEDGTALIDHAVVRHRDSGAPAEACLRDILLTRVAAG